MTEDVKQLIQDARKGDAISQASLATRYRDGDGVSKSTIKAIWWYERARFIDEVSDDDPDFVVINYAAFCEDNIYLSLIHRLSAHFSKAWEPSQDGWLRIFITKSRTICLTECGT